MDYIDSQNDSGLGESDSTPSSVHPDRFDHKHIDKVEIFSQDLQKAIANSFPRPRTSYTSVHVLLLRWAEDDLNVQEELTTLKRVFEDQFNFAAEQWDIPGLDSIQATRALQKKLYDFQDTHQGEDELLIVYYGGHGDPDRRGRSIWAANKQPDSPTLNWSSLQHLLETAIPHVLIILDCCYAANAARDTSDGTTKELLAACGRENPTLGIGVRSFTSALIEELQAFGRRPFTVAMLHSRLITMRWRLAFTPVYALLSEHGGHSIELVPQPPPPALANPPVSLDSDLDDDVMDISSSEISIAADTRVLLAISITDDAVCDISEWKRWLISQAPWDITKIEVKVEACFESHSTMLITSLPIVAWDMLPDRSAYRFVGFIKSKNLSKCPQCLKNAGLEIDSIIDKSRQEQKHQQIEQEQINPIDEIVKERSRHWVRADKGHGWIRQPIEEPVRIIQGIDTPDIEGDLLAQSNSKLETEAKPKPTPTENQLLLGMARFPSYERTIGHSSSTVPRTGLQQANGMFLTRVSDDEAEKLSQDESGISNNNQSSRSISEASKTGVHSQPVPPDTNLSKPTISEVTAQIENPPHGRSPWYKDQELSPPESPRVPPQISRNQLENNKLQALSRNFENVTKLQLSQFRDLYSRDVTYAPTTHRISKAKKGKMVHRCDYPGCNKVFTRAEHCRRHRANHNSLVAFQCPFEDCQKPFQRADLLARHMERQHENLEDPAKTILPPPQALSQSMVPPGLPLTKKSPQEASISQGSTPAYYPPSLSYGPSPMSIGASPFATNEPTTEFYDTKFIYGPLGIDPNEAQHWVQADWGPMSFGNKGPVAQPPDIFKAAFDPFDFNLTKERPGEESWDEIELAHLATLYMLYRESMWKTLASKLGRDCEVVEAKCFEIGLDRLLRPDIADEGPLTFDSAVDVD